MQSKSRRLCVLRDDLWLRALLPSLIAGIDRHREWLGAVLALLGWRLWRRHRRRRAGGVLQVPGAGYALLFMGYALLDPPGAGGVTVVARGLGS
jgi:hypothetical protein